MGAFAEQKGSALELNPTTNFNQYVRYFYDTNDSKLKRTTDGVSSTYVVANSVTNRTVFRAEDYDGKPRVTSDNNRIIAMELSFYQIQYPITPVGPGNYYDFYQLRSKITRRTLF